MNESIITLAELKAYLGITDNTQDDELGALLEVLPAWLYDLTGTWFGQTKAITERQDYAPVIFLDNWPVVSVEGIWRGYDEDNNVANLGEVNNYRIDETGRITLTSGQYNYIQERKDYDQLLIKYTAGIATVPAPVKQAAKIMLKSLYTADASGGTEISSEQVGSYRKTYKQSNKEMVLLAPYLRVRA